MATNDKLNNFSFSFQVRNAPRNGPPSSDAWNDSFREMANDLSNLTLEWRKLVKIIDGLPSGSIDTSVNAFQFGLDGKNLWVDKDVTSLSDDASRYFNANKSRANTVKEQFEGVYSTISSEISSLSSTISSSSGGLTSDQKNRIGSNVFSSTSSSSSSSLDGKSENNRLNLAQVAGDLYGGSASLDNTGNAKLTNSLKDMVDALLELHNGDWSGDIALSHAGAISVSQTDITTSHPGNDAYVGVPSNTLEDLNRMRTRIRDLSGKASWTDANSELYSGGASNLEQLLANTKGTGTKTASNPFGYNYDDIDGLNTRLEAIKTFAGLTTQTDTAPTYSSTTYIDNGDSLESAAGKLDTAIATVSGFAVQDFLGLDDTPATYTGSSGLFARVNNTADGIEFGTPVAVVPSDATFNTITVSGGSAVSNAVTVSGNITVSSGSVRIASGDYVVDDIGRGIVIPSPDGTQWRLTVDNAGALVITSL